MKNINYKDRLNFSATLRNREPISDVLASYIPQNGTILEIASGSGEHAVFFQDLFPSIVWQSSDPNVLHRKSIISWIAHFRLSSIMPEPLDIDVLKRPWPIPTRLGSLIKGIVCINMIHISPWSCTRALFEESKNILKEHQFLMLYGPFIRRDKHTSESNLNFDQALKSQDPHWGLRHLDRVNEIAFENGFVQEKMVEMPANNLSIIYKYK